LNKATADKHLQKHKDKHCLGGQGSDTQKLGGL